MSVMVGPSLPPAGVLRQGLSQTPEIENGTVPIVILFVTIPHRASVNYTPIWRVIDLLGPFQKGNTPIK